MFGKNRTAPQATEGTTAEASTSPETPSGTLDARGIEYQKLSNPGQIVTEALTGDALGVRTILVDDSEESIIDELHTVADKETIVNDLRDAGVGLLDGEDDLAAALEKALGRQRGLTVLRANCLDAAVLDLVAGAAGAKVLVLA